MSLHADLLEQARHLATKEQRRPSQASLRRAISAAYYALFHRLVDEATRMMISRGNRDSLRQCLSRAFHHSDMKDVCKSFASNQAPKKFSSAFDGLSLQPQLVSIARAFVDLQEARHQADYNAYRIVKRQEALHHVQLADKAIQDWDLIRKTPQADAFLTGLLVIRRIQG